MISVTSINGETYKLAARSAVQLLSGRGTYGNGSIDWEQEGLTLAEIMAQLPKVPEDVLAAWVDGCLLPLDAFISRDCTIAWVRASDADGQALLGRTGAFLLAYGLASLRKGYQRLGGGLTADGAYYDFRPPSGGIAEADLADCQRAVAQAIAGDVPIMAKKVSYYEAIKHFGLLGEDDILRRIEENDDGGAVSLRVLGDFAELDTGFLVRDLQKMQGFQVAGWAKTDKGCRLVGRLPL